MGPVTKAVRYTKGLWPSLARYAETGNGMVEIDNNQVEPERSGDRQPQDARRVSGANQNGIRPTGVGKKNWLFIGYPKAGQRSAITDTVVENSRLRGIDPLPYLTEVISRLIERTANDDVSDLLPRQWNAVRNKE